MPAILKPDDYGAWLDPRIKNPAMVADFLKPLDAGLMKKHPVSTRVNNPENEIVPAVAPTKATNAEVVIECGSAPLRPRLRVYIRIKEHR